MNSKEKKYNRIARLYPAICSMIVPFVLYTNFFHHLGLERYFFTTQNNLLKAMIPTLLIFSALIYFMQEVFRSTSKLIVQIPLYKRSEEQFPTTDMLLWKTKYFSEQKHKEITEKIQKDFGYQLLTKEEELKDEEKARKIIAESVERIREATRNDPILFERNCAYGFMRNFLGGDIWAFILTTILLITNLIVKSLPMSWIGLSLALESILFVIMLILLRSNAKSYAERLFTAYLETT